MSTRRDFLKTSAAAGVAATVSTAGVFAAGNDTIKIGLIGCGGRGSGAVLDSLRAEEKINGNSPKTEIVAIGDAFKTKADRLARDFHNDDPKKNPYLKYTKQIKVTPDTTFGGLDAYEKVINLSDLVILATPPGFRPYHLEAAIRAGKNIFCEKPVCVDAAGARKCYTLAEESKKKNLAIVAGTQRRHQKGYLETIKQINDGAIGEVVSARCSWNGSPIWFHDREQGMSDAAYQINNWYHFLWTCGDHIVEQHVHNLDVINWILNDHPVRAVGMGGRTIRKSGDPNEVGQIWDHFAVEYEYKNGLRMFSFCRQVPGGSGDVSESVVGTTGRAYLRDGEWTINHKPSGSDDISPYVQEHIDLLNCIRAGKPLNELKQVTDSTFTAVLGRDASYAEKWIKWDDLLASAENTMPPKLTMESSLTATPAPIPGTWKLPPKA
jgi:predicted dehydrogenase